MTDVNFPQDFYLDDVGVWRLKKEKLAELNKPKPMTNEEYLRSCNTEQLAEFIADELNDVVERVLEGVWLNDGDTDRDEYYQRQTDVLEWLKQPHTP